MNSVTFGLSLGQKVRTRYSDHLLTVVGNYITRDGVRFAEVEGRKLDSDGLIDSQFIRENELTLTGGDAPVAG